MKYDNLIIFYLSGTGNALNAARWMIEAASEKGAKTFLYPIDRKKKIELPELNGKTMLGFCYPTHGFAPPWSMIKFFLDFKNLRIVIFSF